MAMFVVAALYVMGGLLFLLSALALVGGLFGLLRMPDGTSAVMVGSGIMLGLAAIADTLVRINAKLK